MANRINTFLIKRSNTPGKVPTAGSLLLGEIALNTADAKLYTSGTTANSILPIGWDRVSRTGDTMTGTLYGPSISATTISANGLTATTISATSINKVDYIVFNTGTTSAATVPGTVYFDNTEKALSYNTSINQGVTVNLGQQQYLRVFNNSGTSIAKGKALEILSAYSGLPSVTLALNKQSGFNVVGVSAEIIPNNSEGIIITNGIISNIKVTGSTVGDLLYASDSIAGELDSATKYLSFPLTARTNSIGYVIQTGTTTGKVFINIQNENNVLSFTDLQREILEANAISTGIFSFSGFSLSTGNTFNITPIQGWIVDNTTNFLKPYAIYVNYSGQTGLTTPFLSSATETYILLTSAATITLLNTFPTPKQRRQNIYIGKIGHGNRTSLINAFNEPDFDFSPLSQLRDVMTPIKLINAGVLASPNGVNLSFNTSAGVLWGLGIGFITDILNPNSISVSGNSPTTFQYRTQTGGTATNTTTVVPGSYDLNGVITPVGLPAKQATNQRIYLLQNGIFRIQYGQTVYIDLTTAVAAAQNETFTTFPNFTDNGILVGILSLRSDTTNLSDSVYAKFLSVSKFGEVMGGTGGLSTTTLQQAYNNSTQPEIVTNSTLGALSIQNGTGNADTVTRLLEGENTAGNVTSFIRADGYISGVTFQTNGAFINNNGITATTISATTYLNLPISGETKYWSGGTGLNSVVQSGSNSLAGGSGALAGGSGNSANSQYSVALGLNSSADGVENLPIKTNKITLSGVSIVTNPNYASTSVLFENIDVVDEWTDYFYGAYNADTLCNIINSTGGTYSIVSGNIVGIAYDSFDTYGPITVISGCSIQYESNNYGVYGVFFAGDVVSEWDNYLYTHASTFELSDGSGNTLTVDSSFFDNGIFYDDTYTFGTYLLSNSLTDTPAYNLITGNSQTVTGTTTGTFILDSTIPDFSYTGISASTYYDVITPFKRPAFVMGSNSIVTGGNSIVLGANITGTSSNTTYVDRLNIKTPITGVTSFNGIGISISGDIINYTLPITIVNTSNLFSTGLYGTGVNASGVTQSNFFGPNAGSGATNANNSNFLGDSAGRGATGASNSNFFGKEAGNLATGAKRSNFLGQFAGQNATSASDSNFFGQNAGWNATNASQSNFFGYFAGYGATGATRSNFLGYFTGQYATFANESNFLGASAGSNATNANNSNFFGGSAGQGATNANRSNFLGGSAGLYATNANNSNFFGSSAGSQATGASNSNFFGLQAGIVAINASSSNFMGQSAGSQAIDASNSNFFGNQAGQNATSASSSNFFGNQAGQNATSASSSNFFGSFAGNGAIGAYRSNFIGERAGGSALSGNNSNFFGPFAGNQATNANNSNFFGASAGSQSTGASFSNFFGQGAGGTATNASSSNFFGNLAGQNATNASSSNFFGFYCGTNAINASNSNFFGNFSGYQASGASGSNFFGNAAGNGATNATFSNIFGSSAGRQATGASYSNLFGFNVGNASNLGSLGSNNIIIGTNISLASGATNSINIGGVLFGTGTYSATTTNPSITGQTTGRIGINVVNPSQALHVSGNTLIQGDLTVTGNTQSLFSGNSSVELVKIIQNGSGDAFVVQDIANGDSSHFVINASGNTAIGLVQPLGNDKLTVSGDTSIYGAFKANTISATTYYNLPLSATTDIFVTANTFNNATYDLTLTRNDGVTITSNLGLLSTDIKVTGGTYNINTGVVTFTNSTGGTFNVTGFTSGMTDTFTTGGTVNNGTATFTKSNGGTYAVAGFSTGNTTSSGTTNYVAKFTGTTGLGDSLIYDNGTNVGIGTTDPIANLHVSGSSIISGPLTVQGNPTSLQYVTINNDLDLFNSQIETNNYGTYSSLRLFRASGTQVAPTTPSSNTVIGKLEFGAYNSGTTTFIANAKIEASMDATTGVDDLPSRLTFFTTPDGSATMVERMRLNNSGFMRIGGTAMNISEVINIENGSIAFENGHGLKFQSTGGTLYSTIYSSNDNTVIKSLGTSVLIKNRTGDNDLVTVLDTGNVGIGNVNPNAKLDISGNVLMAGGGGRTLTLEASSAGGTEIKLLPNTTGGYARINVGNTNQPLDFQMNNANVMRITQAGDVGIGTTNPTTKLDVVGVFRSVNQDPTGVGGITAKILSYSLSPYGLVFRAYATGEYSIQNQREANDAEVFPLVLQPNGGNVGIGTTTPTAQLNVNGTTHINGGLTATTISATTYLNLPSSTISPITVVNTSNLFSTALSSGLNASATSNSNFFGPYAGRDATGANNSNFIGQYAGAYASVGQGSNFLGNNAGYYAINANNSNFMGQYAGSFATNADGSNFLGVFAGASVTGLGVSNTYFSSNFLGPYAGYYAINAHNSNFIGGNAGYQASAASYSNFLGLNAGSGATNANESNFMGFNAGNQATNADDSNFFGRNAGSGATSANNSNFLGQDAGYQATSASYSNFLGVNAGRQATGASNSNFMGQGAGRDATGAINSNFFGTNAGRDATGATASNFFGNLAGQNATNANNSNFLGREAGYYASGANLSNFIGFNAGYLATDASVANFLGNNAGYNATNASYSNFFGGSAGRDATNASGANFFGNLAGANASGANNSNFFGQFAGSGATGAINSNFFGTSAGRNAIDATGSNFIGNLAGSGATDANNSNFFGREAGNQATGASYSNLFGFNVGDAVGLGSIGSNNIIIGTNISLASGSTNRINLGGVLFGTGTYSTTTGSPSVVAQSTGRIGINVVSPATNLHVVGNTIITGRLSATTISATTYLNLPSDGSPISVVNTSNLFSTGLAGTGANASGVTYSNFLGQFAGQNATGASQSNFFGYFAGANASGASNSNFIGRDAGNQATNANNSNFLGFETGVFARNASNSNFLGQQAGSSATGASYSNLIGYRAGYASATSLTIGSNNIIIGTNISLSAGTTNSINLGGVLFGTGAYSTTAGTPSIIARATGRIGINVVSPTEALHVSGNTIITGNVTALAFFNSSDARLKNIISKDGDTVKFTWKDKRDEKEHIGYIAQEIKEKYPEQVSDNSDGYLTVNYIEVLVAKIQELENRIKTLENAN